MWRVEESRADERILPDSPLAFLRAQARWLGGSWYKFLNLASPEFFANDADKARDYARRFSLEISAFNITFSGWSRKNPIWFTVNNFVGNNFLGEVALTNIKKWSYSSHDFYSFLLSLEQVFPVFRLLSIAALYNKAIEFNPLDMGLNICPDVENLMNRQEIISTLFSEKPLSPINLAINISKLSEGDYANLIKELSYINNRYYLLTMEYYIKYIERYNKKRANKIEWILINFHKRFIKRYENRQNIKPYALSKYNSRDFDFISWKIKAIQTSIWCWWSCNTWCWLDAPSKVRDRIPLDHLMKLVDIIGIDEIISSEFMFHWASDSLEIWASDEETIKFLYYLCSRIWEWKVMYLVSSIPPWKEELYLRIIWDPIFKLKLRFRISLSDQNVRRLFYKWILNKATLNSDDIEYRYTPTTRMIVEKYWLWDWTEAFLDPKKIFNLGLEPDSISVRIRSEIRILWVHFDALGDKPDSQPISTETVMINTYWVYNIIPIWADINNPQWNLVIPIIWIEDDFSNIEKPVDATQILRRTICEGFQKTNSGFKFFIENRVWKFILETDMQLNTVWVSEYCGWISKSE